MPPSKVDSPSPERVICRWLLRAVLLGAAAVLVLLPDARTDQAGRAEAKTVAGEFTQSNSRAGTAIYRATNIAPGHRTGGSVRIANTGRRSGHFVLAQGLLSDSVGPYQGRLSAQIDLVVEEVRSNGARRALYSGKLAGLRPKYLGVFRPGEARTYQFILTFPDTGMPTTVSSGDNRFAGATVRAEYDWVSYDDRPPMRGYTPPNRPGPRVVLSTYRIEDALRLRAFTLMVRCSERCRLAGSVRLDRKTASASKRLARFSRTVSAGRRAKLRVRLTRRSRKLILRQFRARKRAKVIVDVRATNRLGAATIKRARVHLKPVRKRSSR